MLNGEKLSTAHEMQLAQEEYENLRSENELLKVCCMCGAIRLLVGQGDCSQKTATAQGCQSF